MIQDRDDSRSKRSSTFAEGDRKVLEARCRSPTTAQRDLKRARIVLLAAAGRSTRSIAKEVGVQPRIVSRWRHRFADHGLDGLKDKPRPGKKPIYAKATDKRILALLDKPPPARLCPLDGTAIGQGLGRRRCSICLALPAGAQDRPCGAQILVREQRSRVRGQSRRCRRPLYRSARQGDCSVRRRKAFDPGFGTGARLSEAAERARLDRPEPRLQAARHDDACLRRSKSPPERSSRRIQNGAAASSSLAS